MFGRFRDRDVERRMFCLEIAARHHAGFGATVRAADDMFHWLKTGTPKTPEKAPRIGAADGDVNALKL